MVNTDKLKGRIRELGKTQGDCASALGIKPPTFNQKINNIRPFLLTEAGSLALFLQIANRDFALYFFAKPDCIMQHTDSGVVS